MVDPFVNARFQYVIPRRYELFNNNYLMDWPRMRGYLNKVDIRSGYGDGPVFTLRALVDYEKDAFGIIEFRSFSK